MPQYLPAWAPVTQDVLTIAYANVNPSVSGPLLLNASQRAAMLDNGDFEIEVRCKPALDFQGAGAVSSTNYDFYVYQGFDTGGKEHSLQFIAGTEGGFSSNRTGTWKKIVADVVTFDGTTTPVSNIANILGWLANQEVLMRGWTKPSMSVYPDAEGCKAVVMGCTTAGIAPSQNTPYKPSSGSAIPGFNSFAIGSKTDGTKAFNGTIDQVRFLRSGTSYQDNYQGILELGDSIDFGYPQGPCPASCMRSGISYRAKPGIVVFGHAGAKFIDMISDASQASLQTYIRLAKVITTFDGINDVFSAEPIADFLTAAQNEINAYKAINPTAKIVRGLLCPGTNVSMTAPMRALWAQANAPSGLLSLANVDAFVTAHVAQLGDNPGWNPGDAMPQLQSQYQAYSFVGNQDGLHLNGAGDQIKANATSAVITALGPSYAALI